MRHHTSRNCPQVIPIKFVRGGENLDIANSILRTEMKSNQTKKSKSKKSAAIRSSKRRSASIERIFEKKKVDEKKKQVEILKQQFNQLKEREKQLGRASRADSIHVSNVEKKLLNNPKAQNISVKGHSEPIKAKPCFSIEIKPVNTEVEIKPSQPDIKPISGNKIRTEYESKTDFVMGIKSSQTKIKPIDKTNEESKDNFGQIISKTMAARRTHFVPIFDSDSDTFSDDSEETEF